MPRKPRYKRPGYMACGKMVFGDAKKALVIAKGLKSLLNVEIKNHDVQTTSAALDQTFDINQLTNIAQGDTTVTRDGAQCKVVAVEFNALIIANDTNPKTAVRLMLVCDKQTNQAIYNIADLLDDSTAVDNIVSPLNLNNKHRFNVIYDRVHYCSLAKPVIHVKRTFKMNLLIRYDGSTPSIADLTQNSLSFNTVSNEATNTPTIAFFHRIRYVDN